MRVFLLLLLLAFSSLLTAQCGNRYNTAIFPNTTTVTHQFGENTDYAGVNKKLNLDLYTPVSDTVKNRPCVVFCFGGAFVQGTRNSPELVFFATNLAQRGFVCASIDYRLDNQANLTANGENGSVIRAVQDAKAAIRFLKSKSSEFGIDSNMVFIGGTSAGGITALTLGYSQFDELKDSIKTVINNLGGWEGTTNNIAQSSKVAGLFNFAGAILDTNHIANNDLPVYLNHANGDATVPFRSGYPLNGQSKTFVHGSFNIVQRMILKGNYYVLDSFKSADHPAFASADFLTALANLNLTSENLRKFLYKVMKCDQVTSSIAGLQKQNICFENPVRNILNLPEGVQANEIEMYNLLGKKVRLKYDNTKQIDISHITRGIYLIKYKESVQKIVLE
jgi:poly(3-hydroxybutyrate) depolymerase